MWCDYIVTAETAGGRAAQGQNIRIGSFHKATSEHFVKIADVVHPSIRLSMASHDSSMFSCTFPCSAHFRDERSLTRSTTHVCCRPIFQENTMVLSRPQIRGRLRVASRGKLVIARVGPAVGGPRSGPGCWRPAKTRQPRVRVVSSNSKRPYLVFRRARYRRPNSPRRWGPIGTNLVPTLGMAGLPSTSHASRDRVR